VKVNLIQKIMSRFYPITIERLSSEMHPNLLLQYHKDEWLLETGSALYSKGLSYAPFNIAFKQISQDLANIDNFLLLGTGLGSALAILQKEYNIYPKTVLIDYDSEILELSRRVLGINRENVEFHCASALNYLESCSSKFDLIGIDIFKDMTNAEELFEKAFFHRVQSVCSTKAICILNAIFTSSAEESKLDQEISSYFKFEKLNYRRNKIYIMKPI